MASPRFIKISPGPVRCKKYIKNAIDFYKLRKTLGAMHLLIALP